MLLVDARHPATFRNIVLALNLEGLSVVKPFVETILLSHPWRVIKQWSWNPVSFIFVVSVNHLQDVTLYFETRQAEEILAAINHCVSLNLKQLKEGR